MSNTNWYMVGNKKTPPTYPERKPPKAKRRRAKLPHFSPPENVDALPIRGAERDWIWYHHKRPSLQRQEGRDFCVIHGHEYVRSAWTERYYPSRGEWHKTCVVFCPHCGQVTFPKERITKDEVPQ